MLQNRKIVLGNTNVKRDFLFVLDFVDAISLLLESKLKGYDTSNIGSGTSHTILSICKKLSAISGKSVPIEIDEKLVRQNDIKHLASNPSKLQKLGWKPRVY